jgi:tRNA modification GTPase
LLSELGAIPGLRLAEPGEFTRRAVENGRLDLTQAEAIADLVEAETEAQRRQAVRQLEGGLGKLYEGWRGQLIRSAAWIEATIDFPDEEIPPDAVTRSRGDIVAIANEMQSHLSDGRRGEILRDGLHVVVIGPPNSGKSSLVNALAQRDVAIVSDIPGTTRDVLEVRLNLKGYPVILSDTAGLREAWDPIEEEGIRRAQARAESADLRLLVLDGSAGGRAIGLSGDIEVRSKADLVRARTCGGLWISTKTGEGLPELIDALARQAEERMGLAEAPALSRDRHRLAVKKAERHLRDALAASAPELCAEHLRLALREIGRITGRVDLDELLDVVFRDFCLGK